MFFVVDPGTRPEALHVRHGVESLRQVESTRGADGSPVERDRLVWASLGEPPTIFAGTPS